jgi:4-hydroxy-4-methyl-2-oxoglutarate aldolase
MSEASEPLQTAEAVHRLRKLDCCAVSDAFDRLGLTGVVTGVPRASGVGTLAGRVTTVKLGLGDPPPGPSRHLGTTAIDLSGPDNVIVIEQRTGRDAGSWGGILTQGAVLRGVAGVLADGPVRDIDEARIHNFSIFSRSFTARTARGRITEIGTNVPIIFEGVHVNPGDYVIADSSGIAFIPADNIASLLNTAEDIGAKEAAMIRALREGLSISQVMGSRYEDLLKSENQR